MDECNKQHSLNQAIFGDGALLPYKRFWLGFINKKEDKMKNFKCYKCSKCGKRVFFPFFCLPKPYKYEICCCCGEKVFMKRDRIGGIYSLFIQFINFVLRIFRNILDFIKNFWWIFAISVGIFMFVFGLMYSVVSFNKHTCDRIHQFTGYEINFDFYGGCFIKKNGEWFSYDKYMKVDLIK